MNVLPDKVNLPFFAAFSLLSEAELNDEPVPKVADFGIGLGAVLGSVRWGGVIHVPAAGFALNTPIGETPLL